MHQNDSELSKKVFGVLDALSAQFPRDFGLSSFTINSTTEKRAMHYTF